MCGLQRLSECYKAFFWSFRAQIALERKSKEPLHPRVKRNAAHHCAYCGVALSLLRKGRRDMAL